MSQIIYSQTAVEHLQKIAEDWRKEPQIGKHALGLIIQQINRLDIIRPNLRSPNKENQELRLLNVKIGANGFLVHYQQVEQQLVILSIKSYQDAGFSE